MESCLRCDVAPGQFTGEYAVSAAQSNGEGFSLFVDENLVDWEQPQDEGGRGEGWLLVEVVDRKGDEALIRLPAPSLEGGQCVTVRSGQLRSQCVQNSRRRPPGARKLAGSQL
jgi:hypothetical protein